MPSSCVGNAPSMGQGLQSLCEDRLISPPGLFTLSISCLHEGGLMNIYLLLSCNPIMLYLFYCLNHPSACCGELCQLALGPREQMPVVMSLILALSSSFCTCWHHTMPQAHCVECLPSPAPAIPLKSISSCYWRRVEPEIHVRDGTLNSPACWGGGQLSRSHCP